MNEQKQKNEEALTTITKQNEKLIVQERRINQLEAENGKLKENFKELSSNFNRLDQYGRRRHLEIHGIQERHNEDLRSIVTNIGKTLQLPVNDIDVVHRLKTKVKKRSPIIMTFISRTSRVAWIIKRKTGLVSNNIVGGSDDQPIFINVNLTKFNKDLFWKCRLFKKLKGFKYCWVNPKGDIYLKKKRWIITISYNFSGRYSWKNFSKYKSGKVTNV